MAAMDGISRAIRSGMIETGKQNAGGPCPAHSAAKIASTHFDFAVAAGVSNRSEVLLLVERLATSGILQVLLSGLPSFVTATDFLAECLQQPAE